MKIPRITKKVASVEVKPEGEVFHWEFFDAFGNSLRWGYLSHADVGILCARSRITGNVECLAQGIS